MWKTLRIISLLSCMFDTAFLAFIWIMGWSVLFWIYAVISIVSVFYLVYQVSELEKKLK